jgi:hypothetical protein
MKEFEQACFIAIQNRSYSGMFLLKVIEKLKVEKLLFQETDQLNPLPTNHENMRGCSYFK